ncbi:hypothetical protein BDW02DRAFT_324399 [Decorospora gaudefroyi]|uniref:Post-transcriptional regulator MKT1 N-terminal domain-containing protein n=1 Tax=Decorospora gaudefroyi TaxID=184978 RepID=A0A6A5K9Z8_9PLEO|nr:hypothetical protein BDW02DRAFT_324399 [Decorospora gaudefroyi]
MRIRARRLWLVRHAHLRMRQSHHLVGPGGPPVRLHPAREVHRRPVQVCGHGHHHRRHLPRHVHTRRHPLPPHAPRAGCAQPGRPAEAPRSRQDDHEQRPVGILRRRQQQRRSPLWKRIRLPLPEGAPGGQEPPGLHRGRQGGTSKLCLHPMDGGESPEYRNLVSSKLVPLRTSAINLLSSTLHNWYLHNDIEQTNWFSLTEPNKKPTPTIIHVERPAESQSPSIVDTWNVKEATFNHVVAQHKSCGLLGSAILALQDSQFVPASARL